MMTTIDNMTLTRGNHSSRDAGVCLMEAVAWFAGEPHSDSPACVCPVLASFGRELNDVMPDDDALNNTRAIERVGKMPLKDYLTAVIDGLNETGWATAGWLADQIQERILPDAPDGVCWGGGGAIIVETREGAARSAAT